MTIQRFGRLGYRPGIASFSIALFVALTVAGPAAAQYIYPRASRESCFQ